MEPPSTDDLRRWGAPLTKRAANLENVRNWSVLSQRAANSAALPVMVLSVNIRSPAEPPHAESFPPRAATAPPHTGLAHGPSAAARSAVPHTLRATRRE